MNRLKKLKHDTINKLESYNHAAEVFHPASYYAGADKGWELASAEYEKIIADLEESLELIKSETGNYVSNVEVDPTGDDITFHLDTNNMINIATDALQKLKEFRND